MNDAELVRDMAASLRQRAQNRRNDGQLGAARKMEERADRLTALADRLDGGVIVPRHDFEYLIELADEHGWVSFSYADSRTALEEREQRLRAMLTASEAK